MSKPILLDAFCGAGGVTEGYKKAGFYVVGLDLHEQPNYIGDDFMQFDALKVLETLLAGGTIMTPGGGTYVLPDFAAIHASPPCQAHTSIRHFGKGAGEGAPELIAPVRELLRATGLLYVIENVRGAPLVNPLQLCGSSFGLNVWRHRLFESNAPIMALPCAHHLAPEPVAVYGDHPQTSALRGGHHVRRARTLEEGQEAMGIDWMPWKELTQAIPPAYTEHIGHYLMRGKSDG
jgi:DNA (cytosine-5)-methyltransferase 1